MISPKLGFKNVAWLALAGAACFTAACSDDDDALFGNAGAAGSSGSAGDASNGGSSSAGKGSGGVSNAGKSNGGASNAGKGNGGSDTGGTSGGGKAGAANGGTAGNNVAGGMQGGAGGDGGDGAGGDGGEPTWGGQGIGGEGGDGTGPIVSDTLDNPGFEQGENKATTFPGWTNEGTTGAAYLEYSDPHTGAARLGHWTAWDPNNQKYTAKTSQTVSPLANGTYSFSMWVRRGEFDEQYLFAKGFDANDTAAEKTQVTTKTDTYTKITLSGIQVTSGSLTVGIYSAGWTGNDAWANMDDAELTLE